METDFLLKKCELPGHEKFIFIVQEWKKNVFEWIKIAWRRFLHFKNWDICSDTYVVFCEASFWPRLSLGASEKMVLTDA